MNKNVGRKLAATTVVCATLLGVSATLPQAQGNRPVTDDGLLGIRLLSNYNAVLRKFGQPNEIQAGGPYLPDQVPVDPTQNGGSALSSSGGKSRTVSRNGFPGQGGAPGGGGGGGGRMGGMGGYPGAMGGGRTSGAGAGSFGGSAGPPAGYGGYPGAMGAPGATGRPMGGGGLPGFGGGGAPGGEEGGGPPGGFPGGAGGAEEGSAESNGQYFEQTWWYHKPKQGLHYAFLFNKQGQVIQIQEYGNTPAPNGTTRKGVKLGSPLGKVLSGYGWSNDGEHDGDNLIMRYGTKRKIAFQAVKNIVRGITVAVVR